MKPSIRTIRYFVAACELGSISKASVSLSISNSAISAAIDAMEQEFGMKLLLRQRSKGVALTAAGRKIFANAKHLLDDFEHFLSRGKEIGTKLTGTLKIGYFAPVSPAFLPEILAQVIDQGEDVYFDLIACNNEQSQEGLLSGRFDVAIFLNYAVHSDIAHSTLMQIPPYLIVPEQHCFATRSSVRFAELEGEDFILLNLPTTQDYYDNMLRKFDVRPNLVMGASSVEMVRSAVAKGLGCSILNMKPATNETYSGARVVCVPISDPLEPTLELVIGHLEGPLQMLSQVFVDRCKTYFSSGMAQLHKVVQAESTQ
ncbi:LysR family transcriptional regulator [uncultured Tateyamaria sp.]|uniref:LysR family transcriptional regulator n=1 Tax=uncultured Tateyamaria sp. TaxID=455651 RepID=UPI00260A0FDD|nr:LysR family transcriptional regulator [uncultured Tateyamaria sp.]